MAKTQFNNTWEISATPYVPVPHLVLRHCENLRTSGVSGIMASWTRGGYPPPNLAAAKAFYFEPGAFYMLREKLESGETSALERISIARERFRVARRESTIACEASNHYYAPLDLWLRKSSTAARWWTSRWQSCALPGEGGRPGFDLTLSRDPSQTQTWRESQRG